MSKTPAEPATGPEEEPWYKDGLRFKCTQCGNCCSGFEGFVWLNQKEVEEIAEFVGKSIGEFKLDHTKLVGRRTSLSEFKNGDCTFFDPATRGCKIYPVRPRQCRTWLFWDSNLESPEAWAEAKKTCPGMGKGTLIPLEEIERQAAIIRL